MKSMIKPNYENGSIVNLMSLIRKNLGSTHNYNSLENINIKNKNIVFIIIDGLGYDYLNTYGKNTFLYNNLRKKITSVFPSTTVSALTTLSTGLAPQQHALTGWYMYLKEVGLISAILPFTTRAGGFSLSNAGIEYNEIFNEESFFEKLDVKSITIKHKNYIDSEYTQAVDKGAERLPYFTIEDFFKQIENGILKKAERKYIVAYWPVFDSLSHEEGSESLELKNHLDELDKYIKQLTEFLVDKNTTIIITADHGLIDTKEQNKIIKIEEHPRFIETLLLPLSGEPRSVYCYVRPDKVVQFEEYVNTEFKNVCEMHKAKDLIDKKYFGLFQPNVKLLDRIGDYVLIMKDNYIMNDLLLGEDRNIFTGNHGGLSEQEMYVPLIVID